MTSTSDWLLEARTDQALSQADLAAKLDVSKATISAWERGKHEPTPEQLKALRKALKLKAMPPVAAVPTPKATQKTGKRVVVPPAHVDDEETPVSADPPGKAGRGKGGKGKNGAGGPQNFNDKLWAAADTLRGSMDAAEYKHVVLGLIFLKYISDAFEARRAELAATPGDDPEDPDEYAASNVFWVPEIARWGRLQAKAKDADIGVQLDQAMEAIEKENPALKGTLPKEYARPQLDKRRLGEVIDLISGVDLVDREHNRRDILGGVYEYFLGKFAAAEGKRGGEFYTPSSIVRTLVEMIEPYKGRVYDPACGSGGMFVQSEKFVENHGGKIGDISVYGQESNPTTWRLCKMNLAIRGIEANLGHQWGDSFHDDRHIGLKADFVLANPPFNDSEWGGAKLKDDARWQYGVPPIGNANYAWLQHILSHLSPRGVAGVVLANGSMSSQQSGEGAMRQKLVEADLVDCMVALPGQLFQNTQIPACLWILTRNKGARGHRKRSGEMLFIDARKLGRMVDRVQRVFEDEDIGRIARTYHAWRGQADAGAYEDVPGYCRGVGVEEVAKHDFVLTPGRYVGAEDVEKDATGFIARIQGLSKQLVEQMQASRTLDGQIEQALSLLGGLDGHR